MEKFFNDDQMAMLRHLNAGRDATLEMLRSNSDADPMVRRRLAWLGGCVRARLPVRHLHHLEKMGHNPAQLKALMRLRGVINDGGIGVIIGPSGVGKTQMAVTLVAGYIFDFNTKTRRSVADGPRYATAAEMFRELRSSFGAESRQSEASALGRFIRPSLLVIDEVHEIKSSDYELRRLTEIIDARYRDMAPTLVISNLGRAELSMQLGPSVISRIFECGELVDFVHCPSHRGQSVSSSTV